MVRRETLVARLILETKCGCTRIVGILPYGHLPHEYHVPLMDFSVSLQEHDDNILNFKPMPTRLFRRMRSRSTPDEYVVDVYYEEVG